MPRHSDLSRMLSLQRSARLSWPRCPWAHENPPLLTNSDKLYKLSFPTCSKLLKGM